jgi:tubulin alpha
MTSSEIISIHYGQAGIQIGANIWKNLAYEAGLDENGVLTSNDETLRNSHDYFYEDCTDGRYSPRACFVDTEEYVINECILGPSRLYRQEYCINSTSSASNCFARGKFECYKQMAADFVCAVRRMVEACDAFAGFLTYAALIGGTGTGVSSQATLVLKDMFSAKIQNHFYSIIPTSNPCSTVAPLNAIMHLAECQEGADIRWCFNNSTMYREANQVLKMIGRDCTYQHVNDIMYQVLSMVTAPSRYNLVQKAMCIHPLDMAQNMVPFPELKLVSPAIVPLLTPKSGIRVTESSLVAEAFVVNHELCQLDTSKGKYLTVGLEFKNCREKDVKDAAVGVKDTLQIPFVGWIPNGFVLSNMNIGREHAPPMGWMRQHGKSLLKVSNHTSIVESVYNPVLEKFSVYLSRRAFVPWYVREGMTEDEFLDAKDRIQSIVSTIQKLSSDDIPEDDEEEEEEE